MNRNSLNEVFRVGVLQTVIVLIKMKMTYLRLVISQVCTGTVSRRFVGIKPLKQ